MICQHQILPIFLVKSNWSTHHQCFSLSLWYTRQGISRATTTEREQLGLHAREFKVIVTLDSNHKFLQPILITGSNAFCYHHDLQDKVSPGLPWLMIYLQGNSRPYWHPILSITFLCPNSTTVTNAFHCHSDLQTRYFLGLVDWTRATWFACQGNSRP